jgi:hypothetical protein
MEKIKESESLNPMPTLYTSLIARQNPKLKTLAPKQQRAPIAPEHAAKSLPRLQAMVADEHVGQFAEVVRLQETAKSIAVIGAGLAGLSGALIQVANLLGLNKPHTLTVADGLFLILGLFILHDSLKDKLDDIIERQKNIETRLNLLGA